MGRGKESRQGEERIALHRPWAPGSLPSHCKGSNWMIFIQSIHMAQWKSPRTQSSRYEAWTLPAQFRSNGQYPNKRTFIKLTALGAGTLRTGISILGARFWAWIPLGYCCSSQCHTLSSSFRSRNTTKQGSAYTSSWTKSSPLPVFVYEVLLEHRHAHLFKYQLWPVHTTQQIWVAVVRDHMTHMRKTFIIWPFKKVCRSLL